MLKIFITVVIAVFVGGILLKYWKGIFNIVASVILTFLLGILLVLDIPFRIIRVFMPSCNCERKLIREYDRVFCELNGMKAVSRANRNIKNIESTLTKQIEKRKNRELMKLLNEAKWVI